MDSEDFLEVARPLADYPWFEPSVDLLDEVMGPSGSHDFGHLLRVLKNAERIRKGEVESGRQVDREVLAAAALLHDVVDLSKDDPQRHLASRRSAEAAVDHYKGLGAFDAERLERIHHAISAHSFSAGIEARSLEAQILTDADRLDALGAIGIARCFYVSGEMGRSICDMGDLFAEKRELDDLEFAVDHFYTKLLQLRGRLYTETGRKLADERHAFMERFLDQLADELS